MRTNPTELSNRSRYALWRRKIDHSVPGLLPFSITNARSMLRACGGEISMHSRFGFWARKIAKAVDAANTVETGIDTVKRSTNGEVSLSSEHGRWMPIVGPTLIG